METDAWLQVSIFQNFWEICDLPLKHVGRETSYTSRDSF